MEQANSQTVATFTGTLLRRERALERRFVQLVFREDDKDWLCVSTDPRTATLSVGQSYHIEGEFKERGERSFIYNPKIAQTKSGFPVRRVAFVAIVTVCVLAFGGVAYMYQHGDNGTTAQSPHPAVASAATTASTASQQPPSVTPAAATTTDGTVADGASSPIAPTTPTTTPVKHTTKPVTKKITKPVVSNATSDQNNTTPSTGTDVASDTAGANTPASPSDNSTGNSVDQVPPSQDGTPPTDTVTDQTPAS